MMTIHQWNQWTRTLAYSALMASVLLLAPMAMVASAEDTAKSVNEAETTASAEQTTASDETVVDFLGRFWARLKSMTTVSNTGGSRTTAVAGLRGAKEGEEELSPYWKGEIPDAGAPDQVAFAAIRELVDKNDYAKAEEALLGFRQAYAKSPLRPHAELTLALCQLQQQKHADARATLEAFLTNYGDTDMAPQAKAMLGMLPSDSAQGDTASTGEPATNN